MRILIVDDEPLARQGLRQLLAAEPDVRIVGECAHGHEAVDAVGRLRPDLLLLDVQMPRLDGFGVIEALGAERLPPAVIFVTAYERFALRAFEVCAVDYLLKPLDAARLARALRRARVLVAAAAAPAPAPAPAAPAGRPEPAGPAAAEAAPPPAAASPAALAALLDYLRAYPGAGRAEPGGAGAPVSAPPAESVPAAAGTGPYLRRLMIQAGNRVVFVDAAEVDWVEAADYYVNLHLRDGRSFLLRKTMQEIASQLDPACFARLHRSALVNLDRVKQIQACGREEFHVTLADGTQLKASRRRLRELEARFGRFV